ncbi:MAG: DUF389 domain-containing protein [Chloroflexi bacterium]|nr:DUF389 domain-containing protein [Chloroflexota bacterium]
MSISDDDTPFPGSRPPAEYPENEQPAQPQEEEALDPHALSEDASTHLPSPEETTAEFDFPRLDNDVAAFRRELDARKISLTEHHPEDEATFEIKQPLRRRRRSARITDRLNASDLGEQLASIIQRSSPTIDFFVYSLVCGCILGAGYILDAPAILVMGILAAPLLGPWVGTALSAATGEIHLFRQTFGGMLTGTAMVFFVGILAGYLSRIFQPLTSTQALHHAHLWWPDLLMLVIGTVIMTITFIQTDDKPTIASLMIAYEIFLPISAAGF